MCFSGLRRPLLVFVVEFAFIKHEVIRMPAMRPSDGGLGGWRAGLLRRRVDFNGSGFAETTTEDFAGFWCITWAFMHAASAADRFILLSVGLTPADFPRNRVIALRVFPAFLGCCGHNPPPASGRQWFLPPPTRGHRPRSTAWRTFTAGSWCMSDSRRSGTCHRASATQEKAVRCPIGLAVALGIILIVRFLTEQFDAPTGRPTERFS